MAEALFLGLYKYNSLNLYKKPTRRVMSPPSASDEDTEAWKVLQTCPKLLRFKWQSHDWDPDSLTPKRTGSAVHLGSSGWTLSGGRGSTLSEYDGQ